MADSLYSYIILKWRYLPTKVSNAYSGRKYIANTRVLNKFNETDREPVKTTERFLTTLNRNESRQVKLQSYNVETYEIEIFFKENIGLSELIDAEKITLVDENGQDSDIEFMSASGEDIGDTTLQKAIFKFSKRLNDTDCVNNFVTSELINDKFSGRINYLELSNNKNVDSVIDFVAGDKLYFYTIFYPYNARPVEKKQIEKTDGKILNVNVKNHKEVNFKLYLTENEYNIFAKYADACYYKDASGNDKGVRFITDSTAYQAAQNLEYEVVFNEELIDLIEINCKIKMDFINYYNY